MFNAPPPTFEAPSVAGYVIVTALLGMVLGGLVGLFGGSVGPEGFAALIPWEDENLDNYDWMMLGSYVGAKWGGLVGVFAVLVQLVASWFGRRGERS